MGLDPRAAKVRRIVLSGEASGSVPAVRRQIRVADAHVGELSGQPYGERYLQELLPSDGMVLDSRPTTAAVLAAGRLRPGADLEMLRAIQSAHYVDGAHVTETATLEGLAKQIGLDVTAFQAAVSPDKADEHMVDTQRLMQRLGVGGFPAVFIEQSPHPILTASIEECAPPGGQVWALGSLRRGQPEAAAIGERTKRMRIGTNLMLLPLADPLRLAEDAAAVSILTDGRFDLGVGDLGLALRGDARGVGQQCHLAGVLDRHLRVWGMQTADVAMVHAVLPADENFPERPFLRHSIASSVR